MQEERRMRRDEENPEALAGSFSTSGTIRELLESVKEEDVIIQIPIGGDTDELE